MLSNLATMNNILALLISMTLSVSTIFGQTQTCLENLDHPSFHSLGQSSSSEDLKREYILYIPENYDENLPSPLVIAMHGFGDCASSFSSFLGEYHEFNKLADQENFIVAYPQGAYRPEKEDTYWEPGDNGMENILENDVFFIEELVKEISNNYNINSNKIYACGYSNGGMMSYSLACNQSNLFSGIGIMSGTMLEEECMPQKSIPIIAFHGIADEVLPYEGNIWYQSVADVVDFWLDKNAIDASSQLSYELNDGKVILDEYSADADGACLSLYTINEELDKPGGHDWFSAAIEGRTPNKIMWDFFNDACDSGSTSTQDVGTLYNLNLFPNPAFGQINVETSSSQNQVFTIFNAQGKIVYQSKILSDKLQVDLRSFHSGMYFAKIDGTYRKFIKQ